MPKGGAPTFCTVCGKQARARFLCNNHYKQWQYRQNPEKYRAWEARRRLREPDRIRAADRERYRADPSIKKAGAARRKARLRGAEGSHTVAEWLAVLADHDGRCVYCGEPATTRDHIIPINRGGTDYIDNIAPACFPCNASKQDRLPSEWRGRLASSA